MTQWGDIHIFLVVARSGSIRAAGEALNASHSTVLRHIAQLEAHLGTQLFERLSTGYSLTPSGQEILDLAEQMEQLSNRLEGRVLNRDQSLTGLLRVALPTSLGTEFLMPHLSDFAAYHPAIELHILTSLQIVSLAKRQADVALRIVLDRSKLPPGLFGTPLHDVYGAVYVSRAILDRQEGPIPCLRWLLKPEDSLAKWTYEGTLQSNPVPIVFTDVRAQVAGAKSGMGMARLPCFVGDADPGLVRMPGSDLHRYGTLWLLTQSDTRKTKRVRVFLDFIRKRIAANAALLTGDGFEAFASRND